jgi:hypothetical protein
VLLLVRFMQLGMIQVQHGHRLIVPGLLLEMVLMQIIQTEQLKKEKMQHYNILD